MNKLNIIKLIDIAAFISFIFVISTGVLLRYVLPTRSGHTVEIMGMTRHEWGDLHYLITVAFLFILTIHLVVHWRFFFLLLQGKASSTSAYRIVLGIVALLAILALAIAPFVVPLEYSEISKGVQYGKYRD